MPSTAREAPLPTVFLHSSFRTSSTWLWSKFRDDPRRLCLYEVFQERLSDCTLEGCFLVSSDSWPSGHPAGLLPYLLEFIPLLRPSGGVEGYHEDMAYQLLIPEGGLNGELSEAERLYLMRLDILARTAGRQPIMSCTRSLGRAAAIKKVLGGVHVVMWRNLHHQWLSYVHQQELGNEYFLKSVGWTLTSRVLLENHGCDPILRLLFLYLVSHCGTRTADWIKPEHHDSLYIAFVALHVYLTMHAQKSADILVDVNRLTAGDPAYRRSLEGRLSELSRLPVQLDDPEMRVQRPRRGLRDQDHAWQQIDLIFGAIKAAMAPDDGTLAFGQEMLDQARSASIAERLLPAAQ
ncbi:MAG TPA: hypothetical protein VM661_09550 [Candidatus Sulfotelmatobacter sp.]|nr:hypothetical protein [Candidatus Sulfotelmatobacter sp.]